MSSAGLFTTYDLTLVGRAAALAETLTQAYFGLAGEWNREPYALLTRKHVSDRIMEKGIFAQVIRVPKKKPLGGERSADHRYGVLLQDPDILHALLRSSRHDLWTLALFILTHELVHIIRFRKFGVDFFASDDGRIEEEALVHSITGKILAGTTDLNYVFDLYERARLS